METHGQQYNTTSTLNLVTQQKDAWQHLRSNKA
jgi:hypothetical protein